MTDDGAAWCWGYNHDAQLGDGTKTDRPRAVRVVRADGGLLDHVTAIQGTCALTSDGVAWCWGDNIFGQVGDGTFTDRRAAVRVLTAWALP